MKSMNRQFGKLMKKGPGDKATVGVLLKDYDDADKMLAKIIEASRAWRDAWISILSTQVAATSIFEELYNPIVGATDDHGHAPVITDDMQMERTIKLKDAYSELKTDLMEEVTMMDARVIRPAQDAMEYIQPIKKTIKKRDNKRLDWERYQDRVINYQKKLKRSDRENAAMAKAEEDLGVAAAAFKAADEHLQDTLPPIIAAAFSILPHLLAQQILIQNTLLAQYYTVLHNYCEDAGFPSPSPPMEDVIAAFNRDFEHVKERVESINSIARGKTIHQPMAQGSESKSYTGLNIRNGISSRRPSSQNRIAASPSPSSDARVLRIPSSSSIAISPAPEPSPSPEPPSYTPEYGSRLTPASSYSAHSPAGPSADYFQRGAVQKKKPPPPPPKRIGSQNSGLYVTALYGFEGQSDGDLSFKEGEKIRVIKKTDSTDDWWEGELRGKKGSFPANYCKPV